MKTIDAQEKAFDYVEKGWKVLAVTTKDKRPSIRFMRYGHNSATDELDVISSWFDEIDDLNIGIACEKSGLIVLDLDYRNMCKCSWALAKQLYAETMIVETGDGVHSISKLMLCQGSKVNWLLVSISNIRVMWLLHRVSTVTEKGIKPMG